MKFVYYPSGAVLCCATDDCGSIVVLCADPELTLQERADKAEREVQEILDRLESNNQPPE